MVFPANWQGGFEVQIALDPWMMDRTGPVPPTACAADMAESHGAGRGL